MAKTKISQYDATAGNNTDIDSISIAEGMLPSNVNNALRELMAHLKDMDAGTQALTSPQLTSVDINGGTIDGAVIGGSSAAAISGTTLALSGNADLNGTLDVAQTALVTGVLTTTAAAVFNGGFAANDGSTITVDDNTVNLTLACTDADATVGPMMSLYRNSSSAASDDQIGTIFFVGRNSENNADVTYGSIETHISAASAASAGGYMKLRVASHDGESQSGLEIRDGSAEDEVDVTIGNGAASVTTIAGNLSLGDDNKAIFGAGSDLQIYHDGLHSYIEEAGTGRLHFKSNSYIFYNAAGTERAIDCLENDEVRLYFDGDEKLATTATGIDVTGGITADGLTVDSGSVDTVATFESSGDANAYIVVKDSGSSGGAFIGAVGTHTILGTGGSTERMRIDSSGNLLVGVDSAVTTGSEGVQIYRSGNAGTISTGRNTTSTASHHLFYNPNGLVGSIKTDGSATSYNTSSDYRLKTDAQPMTGATARLKALNPVNFEWIADGERVDGFLAHEAQAIVPEAVTGTKDEVDDDGVAVMQGIDQSKLVPLLVKTIQELEARITALEG